VIRGRNLKLVVAIVQPTTQSEVNEDRLTTLRKRAEVDSKSCIIFVTHEPSEMKRSMARLGSIMGELATTFYREEGRRVKLRIEKKTYSSLELSVRYNFKVHALSIGSPWLSCICHLLTVLLLLDIDSPISATC
jgi:hypothetical protein